MNINYIISFIIYILLFNFSFTQIDTLKQTDTIKDKHLRNAVLLSTFIPGAGQVYNHIRMPKGSKKAFWKVPLIYTILGTTGYFYIKNQGLKSAYKKEYLSREAGNAPSAGYENYDSYSLLSLHDQYENRRNLFFIGFFISYILQITDAAVESHFVNYDLSPNLSLNLNPEFILFNSKNQYSCSIKLTYHLNNKYFKKEKLVSLLN